MMATSVRVQKDFIDILTGTYEIANLCPMMSIRFHGTSLILLFALATTGPLLAQARQIPANAILSDQSGTETRIGQLAATRTVVVIYSAEREAGDYLKAWYQGLKARLPADAILLAVADLGAVPFFVPKNAIIKQLAADYPDVPMLLDWKGSLGPVLSAGRSKATATVYSGGRLQSPASGEYSTERAGTLLEAFTARP
jgi:hypothetical protein